MNVVQVQTPQKRSWWPAVGYRLNINTHNHIINTYKHWTSRPVEQTYIYLNINKYMYTYTYTHTYKCMCISVTVLCLYSCVFLCWSLFFSPCVSYCHSLSLFNSLFLYISISCNRQLALGFELPFTLRHAWREVRRSTDFIVLLNPNSADVYGFRDLCRAAENSDV